MILCGLSIINILSQHFRDPVITNTSKKEKLHATHHAIKKRERNHCRHT